jgi:hypothetical protein
MFYRYLVNSLFGWKINNDPIKNSLLIYDSNDILTNIFVLMIIEIFNIDFHYNINSDNLDYFWKTFNDNELDISSLNLDYINYIITFKEGMSYLRIKTSFRDNVKDDLLEILESNKPIKNITNKSLLNLSNSIIRYTPFGLTILILFITNCC